MSLKSLTRQTASLTTTSKRWSQDDERAYQIAKARKAELSGHREFHVKRGVVADADLPWQSWMRSKFSEQASSALSPRHVALWEWFDALTPGVKPRPRVEVWPRGGAKSSTGEMGATRVGAKSTRRFVLYVCKTQEQANEHVASIASLLESLGVGRAVNTYGASKGWRREQLRTENDFNVAGIGLDVAIRGIKIDSYRPDLIILDDVDDEHDSPEVVAKKEATIKTAILPAGSKDCAVLVLQNLIHQGSIVNRLVTGLADFLNNREVPTLEPAVYDLVAEEISREDGKGVRYRVVSGTPSWVGQDLQVCEEQINEWGLTAFLKESQHEIKLEGAFFAGFDPDIHTIVPPFQPGQLPSHWTYFGGLDWGWDDPTAFVFCATDELGWVHVIQSFQQREHTNEQNAARVREAITGWHVKTGLPLVAFDRNMQTQRRADELRIEADIEAYYRAGLSCKAAGGDPLARWSLLREAMRLHKLKIWRGYNADLIRAISSARYHATKPEHMAHDWCSHLSDALGMAFETRPMPAQEPEARLELPQGLPADIRRDMIEAHKRDQRNARNNRALRPS